MATFSLALVLLFPLLTFVANSTQQYSAIASYLAW